MWEAVTPDALPAPEPPPRPAGSENAVLFGQLALCGLALAVVLALRALAAPLYADLRVAYTAALAQHSAAEELFSDQRHFLPFVQQSLAALEQAAHEVWQALAPPAQPVQAAQATPRAARAHPKAPPDGSVLQSYAPGFALAAPLAGYTVTSAYGWRTHPISGAKEDFHTGIDLAAAEGTPVLAAADGIVRQAGRGSGYGNYLRILHADGDETLYAHLQYLFVHAGQPVRQGMRLGTVGQTGNATGPHLHFELLHQGVRYDPYDALQAAG